MHLKANKKYFSLPGASNPNRWNKICRLDFNPGKELQKCISELEWKISISKLCLGTAAWDWAGDPGSQVQIFASALSESLVRSLARTVPGLLAYPLDRALKHSWWSQPLAAWSWWNQYSLKVSFSLTNRKNTKTPLYSPFWFNLLYLGQIHQFRLEAA